MSYAQRRTTAIALAAAYDGWDRPPTPESKPACFRTIRLDAGWGRKWSHRLADWTHGQRWLYVKTPNTPALDAQQVARERLQNRRHFQ